MFKLLIFEQFNTYYKVEVNLKKPIFIYLD